MIIDNFERTRKMVKLEIKDRLDESMQNYYYQLNLHKDKHVVEGIDSEENKNVDILKIESHTVNTFNIIENKKIGTDVISLNEELMKISYSKLSYNKFINCTFDSIRFINCTFGGSTFDNCNFNNVKFEDCDFSNGSIAIFDKDTKFKNCYFKNCNMSKSIFNKISFSKNRFIETDLRGTILSECTINDMYIVDCDCRDLKIVSSYINKIDFEDKFLSKLSEDTFIDRVEKDKNDNNYYENTFKLYKSIFSKFEANRLLSNAGEYYYLSKQMELRTLSGISKIKSCIFWFLCGYGERPTFALISSIEIVLLFTLIYMFTGLNANGVEINYSIDFILKLPIRSLFTDFMKSLYFSVVTFTTVGYGDITPIGYSIILSGLEMFLGVTMVGVWTATLARKITR